MNLTLSGAAAKDAIIRQSGGKTELLLPVKFADGRTQISLVYEW
ncbi:MAG: hypothetical protein O3B86_03070 [Planctomycetota bacterium]|nr:hypothetical protein [Planctomycetota bacterium]